MKALVLRMVLAADEHTSVETIMHTLQRHGYECAIFDLALESSAAESLQQVAYEASAELQERLGGRGGHPS